MRNLGYMYYFGLRPDFKLAAKYFAAAAEAGHGRAAFDLGWRISGVRA
jgi:TPR repeat protein